MSKVTSDINAALAWKPDPHLRGQVAHIRQKFADDPVKQASFLRAYLKNRRDDPSPAPEVTFNEIMGAKPIPDPSKLAVADAMAKAAEEG